MSFARWIGGVLLGLLITLPVHASDWPQWRGPNFNGSTDETHLPTTFSRTQNCKWAAPLPGPGAGTPIIQGDRVFISSIDPATQQLVALCFDRATGKLRWRTNAGSGFVPPGAINATQLQSNSNFASPSPIADGHRAIFTFGNGDLVALDADTGKPVWARNLQKDLGVFNYQWTYSSTPLLYGGKLYVQILQRDHRVHDRGVEGAPSYLLAFDPETGKPIFKVTRPTDAHMESHEAYTTPLPDFAGGRREVIVAGGDILTGHDPDTGRELWRWGTWNAGHRQQWWRLVPSAVVAGDVVVACAPKRAPVYAIKLGGHGDLSATGLAWHSPERGPISSDVPTPLYYQGKLFIQSDVRKNLTCVEPGTGKVVWSTPFTGSRALFWSSPTGADGKIYTMNTIGEVRVFDAATGKQLHQVSMTDDESDIRASIAAAHGCLFIRTATHLYCIGN